MTWIKDVQNLKRSDGTNQQQVRDEWVESKEIAQPCGAGLII